MADDKNFIPPLHFYKSFKTNNGCGLQFKLATRYDDKRQKHTRCIFLDAAKQTGDKQFDWANKIIMKLDLPDIGEMMATLQKRQKDCELFHKSPNGSTILKLNQQDASKGYGGYYLQISKKPNNGEAQRVAAPLTNGESAVLLRMLEVAVERILGL